MSRPSAPLCLRRLEIWLHQPRRAGLLLAALQGGLLLVVTFLILVENASQPRGWVRTVAVDPNLPIRGRYVELFVRVPVEGLSINADDTRVELRVRHGRLIAGPASHGSGNPRQTSLLSEAGGTVAQLREPLAFFLPEHSADPSRRAPGETLWAEVTLPRQGPPRPLRLGVERQPGPIEPLPGS